MKRTRQQRSAASSAIAVRTVTASELRGRMKSHLREVSNNKVLLVHNRRQKEKYVVDKVWLDTVLKERESILATLEILTDRKLTARLMAVAKIIDQDVEHGRLYSIQEAFA